MRVGLALALLAVAELCSAHRILAYYTYEDKPAFSSANIDFKQLTHLCHGFLSVAHNGSVVVPKTMLEPGLLARAHAAGTRVLVTVGGDADIVRAVIASPATRKTLTLELGQFVEKYGYDGVDLDYEVCFSCRVRCFLTVHRRFLSTSQTHSTLQCLCRS
jgi:GH18 family chitinase